MQGDVHISWNIDFRSTSTARDYLWDTMLNVTWPNNSSNCEDRDQDETNHGTFDSRKYGYIESA